MQELKNMFCNQDIRSYNRSLYAAQNTPVTIIRTSGLVAIVETAQKDRFPCLVEMLSEEMVVVVVEEKVEPEMKSQLSLF